jgi:hypothetical protein
VFRVEDTKGKELDYQNIELPELPLIDRAQEWGIDVKAVELCAQALARIAGKSIQDTTGNSYRYIKRYAEKIKMTPHKACLNVLADTEWMLLLHKNYCTCHNKCYNVFNTSATH